MEEAEVEKELLPSFQTEKCLHAIPRGCVLKWKEGKLEALLFPLSLPLLLVWETSAALLPAPSPPPLCCV